MAAITLLCSLTALAQQTVTGTIVDSETGEPIIGASVRIEGTTQGAVSDANGAFSVVSKKSGPKLNISSLGYQDHSVSVKEKGSNVSLGTISMTADAHMLNDVIITSQVAIQRKTPVAATTIDDLFIEQKLGTKEFPEVLKSTPGVHANKQAGGFGDSEIYMRGFSNDNIAVMVNGVPMNDMEWGGIYWSNWAGLSDVTAHMQTQRGLGAAKLSAPSVGGTINVITKSTDAKRGGSAAYTIGNDGMNKMTFNVSSGMDKHGWAFTLLGGHQWGEGYIQGTSYEGWNYFVNISKRINDSHQLSFTAFGAPQWHNQRGSSAKYGALTIAGWKEVERKYGVKNYKYNPNFGYRSNGQAYTGEAYNSYHKPQLSLNHTWQIDDKSNLSTVAYMSIGRGYGYGAEANSDLGGSYSDLRGANYGSLTTTYRNADGTFDYAAVEEENAASDGGSIRIMSKSINFHNWYGLVSTYTTKIGQYFDVYGGVDFRYYKGTHTNEIIDLLGGDYFVDSSRKSALAANNANASNSAWVYKKLGVGDIVYRDYDSHVWNEGAFFQAEYSKDALSAFVSGSLSNTSYSRHDRLYYDAAHADSGTKSYLGGTIKGGANYNIDEHHNAFLNVGYISRAPKFSYGAFMSAAVSNATNPDARNEKVFSAELGYGYKSSVLDVRVNAYYTKWMDKTMTKSGTMDNQTEYYMNMTGVDALHKGVELEVKYKPLVWLELTGMFSMGDWNWDSNAKGYAYDEHGQPLTTAGEIASGIGADDHAWASINLKGVKVGGSAQTTAALGANVKLTRDLRVGLDWNYYARNYAYYDLSGSSLSLGKEIQVLDPWKIPAASQFDLNASYNFNIGNVKATLSGNVDNLLNYFYISKAWNPSSQVGTSPTAATAENIYCYYNFGRTWSVRLKLKF